MFLPAAIRYGIPYETFWHLNPRMMDIYQSEYIRMKKEQVRMMDQMAWLSGSYIIHAVQTALMPRKARYPHSPRSVEEPEMSGEERFKAWVAEFNAQHDDLPEYGS